VPRWVGRMVLDSLPVDGSRGGAKSDSAQQHAEIIQRAEMRWRDCQRVEIGLPRSVAPAECMQQRGTLDPEADRIGRGRVGRQQRVEALQSCFLRGTRRPGLLCHPCLFSLPLRQMHPSRRHILLARAWLTAR
jgi:hypothetical protein